MSQDQITVSGVRGLQTNNRVSLWNRTFTGVTSDTTLAIDISRVATVNLVVAGFDSCSILPSYQLSTDNVKWTTAVALDSLKINSDASVQLKVIDVSTAALGAIYIRFILAHSDNAYARGTTTPSYSVLVRAIE